MIKNKIWILLASISLIILVACSGETENSKKSSEFPDENLTVIVPFGAGGGTDLYIREIMDIMIKENIYLKNIKIENKEGGSGAKGYSYLKKQNGNAYFVSPTAASFFSTPIVSNAGYEVEDFTPIALMGTEDLFLMVNGDSSINSLDDFIEESNKRLLRVGGVGQISDERMIPEQFAKEADIKIEYVPFQGAGELISALTSDSLDAIVGNPTRSMGQIESGMFKPLAFSGKERFHSLKEVPTFIEEGYNVNLSQPRGIVMPGNISEEQKQWWIDAMKQVSETERWKNFVKKNGMTDEFLFGEDFEQMLKETNETYKKAVKNIQE
ncbi:tripartite tricarboxylate transporter substrate binding protein [Nosocomiicoccus sp. HMSC059G07]|uniref:tripartite tricarboxylate transporter substrate binding protein n=1 Tax=Nosocomiicoccus sp. HMSC059G07 TaxID=1739531 RepID=UPI0008A61A66|nr:tripartite tricarboxylate transporter substrate-binding protein [Nosocomiicoccus sp. HMSC059G07]OFO49081.1 hypothetical protein HMPREF3029_02750 [Nosocomiicoccus sp. HMSC059G07]